MPDPVDPLHTELARLLTQIAEARENGNSKLADLLTDIAAKCLMRIHEAKTLPAPAPSQEPQQPAEQQQQQVPPDKDDEPKT
jgi:hypothetical protein